MKTRLLARLACISLSIVVLSFASFQADASAPNAPIQKEMFVWRALLLVYPNIDVDYNDSNGTPRHLTYTMTPNEISDGTWSFRQYPSIANDYSNGEALVEYEIRFITRPITSLTAMGNNQYWVSPDDTRQELDQYAPQGTYDSILVYWPQTNFATGQQIPSGGWGLGMGPSSWSNGSTYATVATAPSFAWNSPTVGEPWLHEWLHGVCWFYASKGYTMPDGDADGGGRHGYSYSNIDGFAAYYRDLMTGHVLENGSNTGITPDAWRSGSILAKRKSVLADYFYKDPTPDYAKTGTVIWQNVPSKEQYVVLGNSTTSDNRMYTATTLSDTAILSGRVYIPPSGIGAVDSVAVALRDGQVEYWAILLYGTGLLPSIRNTLSISRNDVGLVYFPLTITPGWYTIKAKVDHGNALMSVKAWVDGTNEPDWQVTANLDPGWEATQVGFRHYGQGTRVDDLFVEEDLESPLIPPKPNLLSPPNRNQSRARSRVLDWTDSTGATRYEIEIRRASKTGPIVASASPTSSNYKTPKLGRNYWYWWRVRACATSDPTSCSRWTKPWQYKVLP